MKFLVFLVAYAAITACHAHWSNGSHYSGELWGEQTVDAADWNKAIQEAVTVWSTGLGKDCAFPFIFDPTDKLAGVKYIALVSQNDWDHAGYNGWTTDDGIKILGNTVGDKRGLLIHEIGHSFGLQHVTRLTSIMYPDMASIKVPDPQDYIDARKSIGCD